MSKFSYEEKLEVVSRVVDEGMYVIHQDVSKPPRTQFVRLAPDTLLGYPTPFVL